MKFSGCGIQTKPWLLLNALIHSERFNGAENVTNLPVTGKGLSVKVFTNRQKLQIKFYGGYHY